MNDEMASPAHSGFNIISIETGWAKSVVCVVSPDSDVSTIIPCLLFTCLHTSHPHPPAAAHPTSNFRIFRSNTFMCFLSNFSDLQTDQINRPEGAANFSHGVNGGSSAAQDFILNHKEISTLSFIGTGHLLLDINKLSCNVKKT